MLTYRKKDFDNLTEIASKFQIERDEMAYLYVKREIELKNQKKFDLMNNFVDFNASVCLPSIVPMIIRIQAIDFILLNHEQLKGLFSIESLMEFSRRFNLVSAAFKTIKSFSDLNNKYIILYNKYFNQSDNL